MLIIAIPTIITQVIIALGLGEGIMNHSFLSYWILGTCIIAIIVGVLISTVTALLMSFVVGTIIFSMIAPAIERFKIWLTT